MSNKRRTHNQTDDEDDIFDERGVLRDGKRYRVPLHLCDGLQQDVARAYGPLTFDDTEHSQRNDGRVQFRDAFGRPAGNRPGFIVPTQPMANDKREEAYRLHDEAEANRWRTPPTGEGSSEFIGAREGDLCTVREGGRDEGSPGRLQRVDGRLVCVPDSSRQEDATTDARANAYALADWEAENAWRGREWLNRNRPKH